MESNKILSNPVKFRYPEGLFVLGERLGLREVRIAVCS